MPELRDAFRALRSTPLVTAIAVLSLALGIGANTAIFSLLNAALLRPLPIEDPERLVIVGSADQRSSSWPQSVWAEILNRQILESAFAWFWSRFDASERGERQFVDGIAASGSMFDALGIRPILGRLLTSADDQLEGGPDGLVSVISYRHWQQRFGGSPDVLGRSISLDRRHYSIVGVTPPEFVGLYVGLPLDVVVPLGTPSNDLGGPYVTIMGRLKVGETVDSVSVGLRAAQPVIRDATNPYSVSPYREEYLREPFAVRAAPGGVSFLERRYGQPLKILLGVVGLVLLIACGNVAMLLLARAIDRHRELGVRAALGATRRRLAWQLSLEGVLLAASGVVLGAVFAHWCTRFVVGSLSTQAYTVFLDLKPDWRVLGFTSALGVATAFLFSAAPAFHATRIDPMDGLRKRAAERAGRFRFGSAIVVVQVALSVILLIGTGLFMRTFWVLVSADVGFEPDRILVVSLDTERGTTTVDRRQSYERMLEAIETAPGVARAGASLAMPGGNSAWTPWIELSDGTHLPQGPNGVYANRVTAGWFQTLGTTILTGREFTTSDRIGSPGVVIVNQAFAERFLKDRNPLGRTIFHRSDPDGPRELLEIIGVAESAMYRFIKEPAPPTIYTPLAQMPDPLPASINLSIRAEGLPAAALSRSVAEKILAVERDAALTFRTLSDQVAAQYAQERLVAWMATIFGSLAVLLAALGVYGIAAYAVVRRRAEIGIRMALGAAPGSVVRLVLARVITLIALGVLCGLVGSVWTTQFTKAMLYNVEPGDTATLIGSCALLIAVAFLAAWLPARRAARIDPASVLKDAY
jgi:putative ABC transport system permease protein